METWRKVVAGLVALAAALIFSHPAHGAAQGGRVILRTSVAPPYSIGTSMSSSGAYCCAPKMSGSPGLPLGRER